MESFSNHSSYIDRPFRFQECLHALWPTLSLCDVVPVGPEIVCTLVHNMVAYISAWTTGRVWGDLSEIEIARSTEKITDSVPVPESTLFRITEFSFHSSLQVFLQQGICRSPAQGLDNQPALSRYYHLYDKEWWHVRLHIKSPDFLSLDLT